MSTHRIETFSDGVLAIIITIMVLELKVPEGGSVGALKPILPTFITYVLSFIYLGIYWNNHHHLMNRFEKVNGKILWANLHLLFWLSLFPFATGYMGKNHFQELPTALYGFVLTMASIAWFILDKTLQTSHPELQPKGKNKYKPQLSIALYIIATGFGFVFPIVAACIYVIVALIWFIPD